MGARNGERVCEREALLIKHSELFDEAVYALQHQVPFIDDALQNFEWFLRPAPYDNERCAAFEGRALFIALVARTSRSPSLRLLCEVEDQTIFLWQVDVRKA
ncbi:hypothetical protein BH10PSE4_BH10PSE4_44900 [soil metagenome]